LQLGTRPWTGHCLMPVTVYEICPIANRFGLGEGQRVSAVCSSWLQNGDNPEHSTGLSVNFRVLVDWVWMLRELCYLLVSISPPKVHST